MQGLVELAVPGSVEPHPDRLAAGGRDRAAPATMARAAYQPPRPPWSGVSVASHGCSACSPPHVPVARRTAGWAAGCCATGLGPPVVCAAVQLFGGAAAISRRWVATWPETATAVAIRLDGNDQLQITTACGLQDLLQGVCRRNPGGKCRVVSPSCPGQAGRDPLAQRPNPLVRLEQRVQPQDGIERASCGNAQPASPRPRRGWCCRW